MADLEILLTAGTTLDEQSPMMRAGVSAFRSGSSLTFHAAGKQPVRVTPERMAVVAVEVLVARHPELLDVYERDGVDACGAAITRLLRRSAAVEGFRRLATGLPDLSARTFKWRATHTARR